MYHVTKYSTIRGVFRGGSNGVCQGARVFSALSRHLESGVDPGNEVVVYVTKYATAMKANFPTVTKSSLMNLYLN